MLAKSGPLLRRLRAQRERAGMHKGGGVWIHSAGHAGPAHASRCVWLEGDACRLTGESACMLTAWAGHNGSSQGTSAAYARPLCCCRQHGCSHANMHAAMHRRLQRRWSHPAPSSQSPGASRAPPLPAARLRAAPRPHMPRRAAPRLRRAALMPADRRQASGRQRRPAAAAHWRPRRTGSGGCGEQRSGDSRHAVRDWEADMPCCLRCGHGSDSASSTSDK